jgi:flagellar biosynthesis protein
MDDQQDFKPNITPLKRPGDRVVAVAIKGGMGGKKGENGKENPESLPKVIASGYGKLAEQILAMAFDKGIKVRADADLAELLAMLDMDTPIPSEAIIAVAEVLSKVYETNARMGGTPATPVSPEGIA